MNTLPPPRATMRLQMHRDFPFARARDLVPYFAGLGISHLYLSPILTARAGSTHGYDTVDHRAVNPELGGEDGLRELVAALRRNQMGLLVDIVPNHMAVGGSDNAAWLDLLEWGRASRHAQLFDVDWDVPDTALNGKLLAPFLGKPYGEALAAGELLLHFERERGRFHVDYFEHRFPIAPESYPWLLRAAPGEHLTAFSRTFRQALRGAKATRGSAFEQTCVQLASESRHGGAVAGEIDGLLRAFDPGTDTGRTGLHRLLEQQHYRLAWWRTAPDEINWRRFFDIVDLAGLRIQDSPTFEIVHATLLRLYAEGLVDGFRIDHIDGLADPRSYCRHLRARLNRLTRERPTELQQPPWIVVEKILAVAETLPQDWQIDGTTGYSFMNEVGALLHDARGEAALTELWTGIAGPRGDFESQEREARRRIPQALLASDFNACARALHAIARSDPATRDWTLFAVRRTLAELLVELPVYRTYADARGRSPADAAVMAATVAAAMPRCRLAEQALLQLIDRWLGGEAPRTVQPASARRARLHAIGRFQQLSSPVAAKSVEDTVFYRHGRLLSRNEVGANPAQFALSPDDFHAECIRRVRRFPRAMLATATHDHKRGEDVRARLAVLSEMPDAWREVAGQWRELNHAHKRSAAHEDCRSDSSGLQQRPDAIDEYMLYQTLLGAWPLTLRRDDHMGIAEFAGRVREWQQKALREAKRHSSWAEPNPAYEEACRAFLAAITDPDRSAPFLASLHAMVEQVASAGACNGLAQTLLKLTAPGISDFYQGCEFWDFSLVDPDNRRPVDYAARITALDSPASAEELLAHWRDGRIKQYLIQRVLDLRVQAPDLFTRAAYRPLPVLGPLAPHVFAFARIDARLAAITIVTRLASGLVDVDAPRIDAARWQRTRLRLPRALRHRAWRCQLGRSSDIDAGETVGLGEVMSGLPVQLLWSAGAGALAFLQPESQPPGARGQT
jgi:(1->4)-alpha-D-glucan 1-alpha-D-glucosylmutase